MTTILEEDGGADVEVNQNKELSAPMAVAVAASSPLPISVDPRFRHLGQHSGIRPKPLQKDTVTPSPPISSPASSASSRVLPNVSRLEHNLQLLAHALFPPS